MTSEVLIIRIRAAESPQLLQMSKESRIRYPPIEQRNRVTICEQRFHQGRTEEESASQNQNSFRREPSPRARRQKQTGRG